MFCLHCRMGIAQLVDFMNLLGKKDAVVRAWACVLELDDEQEVLGTCKACSMLTQLIGRR